MQECWSAVASFATGLTTLNGEPSQSGGYFHVFALHAFARTRWGGLEAKNKKNVMNITSPIRDGCLGPYARSRMQGSKIQDPISKNRRFESRCVETTFYIMFSQIKSNQIKSNQIKSNQIKSSQVSKCCMVPILHGFVAGGVILCVSSFAWSQACLWGEKLICLSPVLLKKGFCIKFR